jgi:polysaccharide export outer membrane protein
MKGKALIVAVLFLFLGAASCLAAGSDYLVGPGDVLKVTVYDHPDLGSTVRVNNDGTINFPLVGTLQIEGISVSQVSEQVANALANGYIVNPQVAVFVEEFRSRKVIVMGQVKNPGLYELRGPTSLLELISQAGGLTPDAGETVNITRGTNSADGQEQLLMVDLKTLTQGGDNANDVAILDGDSVFITLAGNVYVTGEVKRPNSYKFERGTSVIKAITMAGGFTELAAKGRVKIIRKSGGAESMLTNVPMHMLVLPEDVIVVPESFF